MLDFRILGPFEVVEGQRAVALGAPKQRALLAILVLRRGEVVSSDRLIDQLWGERPPATAAKTLQGYVSHLRKALGNEVLLTRGGGYVLAAEPGQVDAVRFEVLVTGDGADEVFRGAAGADYLPVVGAIVRAAGLVESAPFLDPGVAPFVAAINGLRKANET